MVGGLLSTGMSLGQLGSPGGAAGITSQLTDVGGTGSGSAGSGLGDLGGGGGSGLGSLGDNTGVGGVDPAGTGSSSFASVLKGIVINNPSQAQNSADSLSALSAAGGDVDPQTLAVQSAKAGIEVQMSTSTISSAVSGLRTLMQMQI